jgi:hypothetical protein
MTQFLQQARRWTKLTTKTVERVDAKISHAMRKCPFARRIAEYPLTF